MGFKTFGFGGGRADIWAPEEDVCRGANEWLATSDKTNSRYSGERPRETPRGRADGPRHLREPRGPDGNPDPGGQRQGRARDLQAHGHERRGDNGPHRRMDTPSARCMAPHDPGLGWAPEPEAAAIELQGSGWMNAHGTGKGGDTTTSGLEGA
ncbi:MAG: hypothetical protein R2810_03975 [Flavobacteriales bacterium]